MTMEPGMRRRLWARSLLLQSCWNFERMQNLGLSVGIQPWLESLYPEAKARGEALSRYQEFFNTNPYMEPLIVGMLCALEEEAARLPADRRQERLARLSVLKKGAAGPLAGLGDAIFWQTLRPLCAAAALLSGFLLWKAGVSAAPAGAAIMYLILFNIPAITLRWRGFELGYQWRDQIAVRLKGYPWQVWIKRLRQAGTALAVVLLALALVFAGGRAERLVGVLVVLGCLIADRVAPRPVSAVKLYIGTAALGGAATLAGWL
ncbi:MAG: PTS system mannose/fructose/sorbose family transporter subunit IID [Elusimicrobia bacterium]|nr:PTS system mannose/fructose/sorbose family transporter subunit IID [Elusimicrobiota bacterium]